MHWLLFVLTAVCLTALALPQERGMTTTAPRLQQKDATGKKSTRVGVYSAAQADRGAKIYNARCGNCHLVEQFVGPVFMRSWSGQTAEALFDLIRNTMPTENPGGLKRQEYADVLAYIFKVNRLPTGENELEGTADALKRVIIEPANR